MLVLLSAIAVFVILRMQCLNQQHWQSHSQASELWEQAIFI
jgi:hypothetical protein